MNEQAYSPPEGLARRLEGDYFLSVMRVIAGRTESPLIFLTELDAILDVNEDQRAEKFAAFLSSLEGRLSEPGTSAGSAEEDSVYI